MSTATTPTAVEIPAGTWKVDPVHSTVGFEVKHFGISTFRGRFTGYEGTIATSQGSIAGVTGTVRVDSVDVQDEQLSAHLQSPDFFDAEQHPEIRFQSTEVRDAGEGRFELTGDLTMHGVTKPVTLDVEVDGFGPDPYGGERLSLVGRGEVDRNEFGIAFDNRLDNGALVVGEKVRLVLTVEAVREA